MSSTSIAPVHPVSKLSTVDPSFAAIRAQARAAGLPIVRAVGPAHALVPSASRPGVTYHVLVCRDNSVWCSCSLEFPRPAGSRCWHIASGLAVLAPTEPDPEPPPPAAAGRVQMSADFEARVAELFGRRAA